jgi:hypothetical protein
VIEMDYAAASKLSMVKALSKVSWQKLGIQASSE